MNPPLPSATFIVSILGGSAGGGLGAAPLTALHTTGSGRTFAVALGCSLLVGTARLLISTDRRRSAVRRRNAGPAGVRWRRHRPGR